MNQRRLLGDNGRTQTQKHYPNRQLYHTIHPGEDPASATRARVCRPMLLDEQQCEVTTTLACIFLYLCVWSGIVHVLQVAFKLATQRANMERRVHWRPLIGSEGTMAVSRGHRTAMIVGSGPSVNTLSQAQFERLKQHMVSSNATYMHCCAHVSHTRRRR